MPAAQLLLRGKKGDLLIATAEVNNWALHDTAVIKKTTMGHLISSMLLELLQSFPGALHQ